MCIFENTTLSRLMIFQSYRFFGAQCLCKKKSYTQKSVCISCQFKVIPVYLLPALMVYVGLLGGASYVNIFYMLLHDDKYPARDRELCINITAMFITLGQYWFKQNFIHSS